MSEAKFEKVRSARLEGFDGPFFPIGIDELSELDHTVGGVADELLTKAEAKKYKRQLMWGVRTSDNFDWARNPLLRVGKCKIAVLFPFNSGTRSVTVYRKGKVKQKHINEIIRMFIRAFKRKEQRDYYRPFYHGRYLEFQPEDELPECHHCEKKTKEKTFFNDEQRSEYIHQSCMFRLFEIKKDHWVRGRDGRRVSTPYFIPGMTW
jgi:hypothetical protein